MKMKQHDQRESDLPVELSEPARRALIGACPAQRRFSPIYAALPRPAPLAPTHSL